MSIKTVSIFGSTGSIGTSTIDLIKFHNEKFHVRVLTAHKNADLLIQQAQDLNPELVVIGDETLFPKVKEALSGLNIQILAGRNALIEAALMPVDITIAAIVGMAGLEPLMCSIEHSRTVAIANKEPLVAAGPLVLATAKKYDTKILPLDSEHNAIFQVFETSNREAIDKIILTASGGPFRTWTKEQIQVATPEQALKHPNWSMGAKISVDSATMMNKALEIIEAHYLFDMPAEKIDVLIHPQSIVHSMVSYTDGSILAQLGAPDMRTPIAYALAYPQRIETSGKRLDFSQMKNLEFATPDFEQFPALRAAYSALENGQGACIALNAVNEIAVTKFLTREISFADIISYAEKCLYLDHPTSFNSIESIIKYDQSMREFIFND